MDDPPRRPDPQPPLAPRLPLPLPTQDEELQAAQAELERCRQRLRLLRAQVALIQRMEAPPR